MFTVAKKLDKSRAFCLSVFKRRIFLFGMSNQPRLLNILCKENDENAELSVALRFKIPR